ncbi:DUF1439 domain-containing protein [Glaciecola sp.]|jgi:hypothetical protein|uniref:DUF1439 domain-containing protein n=1 Tax=Glaciecola sp. MF2-115 TaxID=3384827 RepID=UPI003988AD34
MKILFIISVLFLSACSSMQGLSVYSLNNSDLESVLKQQLPKLSEKMSVLGLPVEFDVKDLSVKIGPDQRDVIALSFDSSASVKMFPLNFPVRLMLQIEGSPFYDGEKKAIFLRNIKLLDSSIDAGAFSGNLDLLSDEAMDVINGFLEKNPVYNLDMDDPRMALLSNLPLNIKVVEGSVKLTPMM